jgi:hypothetical protein
MREFGPVLTPTEAAKRITESRRPITTKSMNNWRHLGIGPRRSCNGLNLRRPWQRPSSPCNHVKQCWRWTDSAAATTIKVYHRRRFKSGARNHIDLLLSAATFATLPRAANSRSNGPLTALILAYPPAVMEALGVQGPNSMT